MNQLLLKMMPLWIRAVLAFAAVYLIWGSTYLAIRFAIETLPPLVMAGARFITSGRVGATSESGELA